MLNCEDELASVRPKHLPSQRIAGRARSIPPNLVHVTIPAGGDMTQLSRALPAPNNASSSYPEQPRVPDGRLVGVVCDLSLTPGCDREERAVEARRPL